MIFPSTYPLRNLYRLFSSRNGICALGITLGGFSFGVQNSWAELIAGDDFTYPDGVLANGANSGGIGWSEPWMGNKRPRIQSSGNLTFLSQGYDNLQHGTGMIISTDDHSGVSCRSLSSPIVGTSNGTDVWFSLLVRVEKNQVQSGRLGFHFNVSDTGTNASRLGASAGFILANTDFRSYVRGGANTGSTSGQSLELNSTHLIVGRVSLHDARESNISIWFDPPNVTNVETLGEASFVFSADLGGSIRNIGVETYSGAKEGGAGALDALRIGSDLASVVASLPK